MSGQSEGRFMAVQFRSRSMKFLTECAEGLNCDSHPGFERAVKVGLFTCYQHFAKARKEKSVLDINSTWGHNFKTDRSWSVELDTNF